MTKIIKNGLNLFLVIANINTLSYILQKKIHLDPYYFQIKSLFTWAYPKKKSLYLLGADMVNKRSS